jgi:transcriptional regulator with XRE-family HTH domain
VDKLPFTPNQLAAARDLLGKMTQAQLAEAAGVSERTIVMFEKGNRIPHAETLAKILQALENRGIEFSNGDNPGVRLNRSKAIIPV